jgi:hypothetical protein
MEEEISLMVPSGGLRIQSLNREEKRSPRTLLSSVIEMFSKLKTIGME